MPTRAVVLIYVPIYADMQNSAFSFLVLYTAEVYPAHPPMPDTGSAGRQNHPIYPFALSKGRRTPTAGRSMPVCSYTPGGVPAGFSIAHQRGRHIAMIRRQAVTTIIPISGFRSRASALQLSTENSVHGGAASTPYTLSGGIYVHTVSYTHLHTKY